MIQQITALMKFNDFTLFCMKYFVSKVLLKNQMDINYKQEWEKFTELAHGQREYMRLAISFWR